MGIRAYIVEYKSAKLGGGADFFDLLETNFRNDDSEVYLETHAWKDLLKDDPSIEERFPEEVKEVNQDLEENNECVTYAFF